MNPFLNPRITIPFIKNYIMDPGRIKKVYTKVTGPEVQITVKEVNEIKDDPDSGKPAPIVVSHVNLNDACQLMDQ